MKKVKLVFTIIATVLGVLLLAALVYCSYFIIVSDRLEDSLELDVKNEAEISEFPEKELTVTLWNIGGGVSVEGYWDYSEGGGNTRGRSKNDTEKTLEAIAKLLEATKSDIILLSEVDNGATRSFLIDETDFFASCFGTMELCESPLYRSPYIAIPFDSPVGYMRNSLLTLTRARMLSAHRVSLPVFSSFMKYLDADRAYSVVHVKEQDRTLAVYNVSLSDFSVSNGELAKKQLLNVLEDMKKSRKNGESVICGGDFSTMIESGLLTVSDLPDGFCSVITESATARDPITGETVYRDAFIVSDDITVSSVTLSNEDLSLSDRMAITIKIKIK